MRSLFRISLILASMLTMGALTVFGQGQEVGGGGAMDVGRALDQPLRAQTIEGGEIPNVLARLGGQAGIRITIEDKSADLLPHGSQTRLDAFSIPQGQPPRSVLSQILAEVGMTYTLQEDGVVVEATEPLKRLNRRATWEELALLRRAFETEYSPEQLSSFKIQYKITSKVDAPGLLEQQLAKAGRGSVAQVLEVAVSALGWVWYPEGDHLRIRSHEAQIANYMSRRIEARYTNEPLARILIDLSNQADAPISFEPGLMLKLPPSTAQSYSLLLRNASIKQAFELVSAETGLEWKTTRDGIHVSLSESAGGAEARARRSAYVGKISVPSADGSFTYEFLLREDELPEDILQYRSQLIEEMVQKMRAEMAPDNAPQGSGDGE